MVCLFFRLLSCDLQVDILSAWVNDPECGSCLLRTISAMDVACSKADRPDLRHLLTLLPVIKKWNPEKSIVSIDSCMKWLHSRKVVMQTLVLSGETEPETMGSKLLSFLRFKRASPVLPSVESIVLLRYAPDLVKVVEKVLCCCPNVTALEGHMYDMPAFADKIVQLVPKLSSLKIIGYDCPSVAFMRAIGPLLRELRTIPSIDLLEALANHCPLLQTLELSTRCISLQSIIQLVESCKCLTELTYDCVVPVPLQEADFLQLIHFQQLKKLIIRVHFIPTFHGFQHIVLAFAEVLECRPDLEFLQVGFCRYFRKEGILDIAGDEFRYHTHDATLFGRIFAVATNVVELKIGGYINEDLAEAFASSLGKMETLRSLSLHNASYNSLAVVLKGCEATLKHLSVMDCDETNKVARAIAEFGSSRLESLVLVVRHQDVLLYEEQNGWEFLSPDDMTNLIAGCRSINQLTLRGLSPHIALSALHAVIFHRLHLKQVTLRCGLSESDLQWFKEQAVEMQLLPVPRIVVEK